MLQRLTKEDKAKLALLHKLDPTRLSCCQRKCSPAERTSQVFAGQSKGRRYSLPNPSTMNVLVLLKSFALLPPTLANFQAGLRRIPESE